MTAPRGAGSPLRSLRAYFGPAAAPEPAPLACRVCRFRLDPVLAEAGTHPGCDPDGGSGPDGAVPPQLRIWAEQLDLGEARQK